MTAFSLPFLQKTNSNVWTFTMLALTFGAFCYVATLLARHHRANRRDRRRGVIRRHDGMHGNH